ncbi:MAG: pyridine nucleotide-disulfide oxidoreductase [Caballeronia mineralivorans]|jgi:sulfide:quinone oxidoreductase|nr:pyridine nucleotide-disulfide oxidoreductase [Caballeronia mineralivorans]MEA3099232.1 sulfide:quinone oxidoreductase [Caballeronia mineralivorans]
MESQREEGAVATNAGIRTSFSVVIVGAGAGGTSVAARLKRMSPTLDIAVIDPSEFHYYQPAWTLVGGGQYDSAKTRRPMRECLPHGVEFIPGRVTAFEPDQNVVVLEGDTRIGYKYLVVAAGIQLDWDAIEGLTDALGKNGVTSNYRFDLAPYTWQCVQQFKGGTALFTQPPMPIKCAGAPQKILYLAADYFRKHRIAADIRFFTPGPSMFGVPFYAKALDRVMSDYQAKACFGQKLVRVDGPAKTAYFEITTDGVKSIQPIEFDLLHVVPPQSAPRFIRESPLADAGGWVEVDKATLRHTRFPNIFGIGDCTSTPNSKTAAAVKNQMPVVATNLMVALTGQGQTMTYDGYASCPLTTSAGKVMLAEFCYDGAVTPSFPMDPRSPRKIYWWLKRSFLPYLYWNIVMKGKRWPLTHKRRDFPEALPSIKP